MQGSERIFIVGGTGNIGTSVVRELLTKNVSVTLFARNTDKVNALFGNNNLIQVVPGNFDDLSPLKSSLNGHSRMFLLISDIERYVQLKTQISQYAFESGIKQIVNLSDILASYPWRTTYLGHRSRIVEETILNMPNRGYCVSLRPTRLMSNFLVFERLQDNVTFDTIDEDKLQGWISPNDIGAVAAAILTEDIEKHADAVYELSGDAITPKQRADVFTHVLNRPITYKKISAAEKYQAYVSCGCPHLVAYTASTSMATIDAHSAYITDGIEILIGRKPETLEKYVLANKDKF